MSRIGSSAVLHKNMAIGKVVETRYYLKAYSDWRGVSQQALANKQYLILTICINHNSPEFTYPSDDEWRTAVDYACKKLKEWGGNSNNCDVALINEPLKYITFAQYAHLIKLATPIIHKYGFKVGVFNEEFITAQLLGNLAYYLLEERKAGRIEFDKFYLHIQGSCNTKQTTTDWLNHAVTWRDEYGIELDCNEAFYNDIRTSKGWELLKWQYQEAKRIGCKNFCNVFNNMIRSAFPNYDTHKWDKLCFKIDGHNRSGYWGAWLDLISTKGPIPNIEEVFEMYGIEINYVKPGCHNEECRAAQQVMLDEGYDLSPFGADSWYGDITEDAIRKWQEDNNLQVDGIIGKETWQWIMENIDTGIMRFMQMIARTGRYK